MGSTPFTSIPPMIENMPPTGSNGTLDPDLESLLDVDLLDDDEKPLSLLIEESKEQPEKPETFELESFSEITQFEQKPDPVFLAKDFYSKVLQNEGDPAYAIHELLQKFVKRDAGQVNNDLRSQLTKAWWELAHKLVSSYNRGSVQKRWALRYGYLLPNLLTESQQQMIARIVTTNVYSEPIHYLDEWLDLIAEGKVSPLAIDEDLSFRKKTGNEQLIEQLNKNKGLMESSRLFIHKASMRREACEIELQNHIKLISEHLPHPTLQSIIGSYTETQKSSLNQITKLIQDLSMEDREIANHINQLESLIIQSKSMEQSIDSSKSEAGHTSTGNVANEFTTIIRLIKLCVGRQGNHFPFLMGQYIPSNLNFIATRENIIQYMKEIEEVDPSVFLRTFKRQTNRIVPHTIILPCYGDKGFCWEPYERFKRATSRGRIAIPLYPKDVKMAIIYALGDLRWNVAKEEAANYWLTEGLTGMYNQWFIGKNRGDVKQQFLDDYFLWVTKEVDGIQKMEKEVRSIFWRYIPFKQSVKDVLRDRGYVYNELYRKDMNRTLSDGY